MLHQGTDWIYTSFGTLLENALAIVAIRLSIRFPLHIGIGYVELGMEKI